MPLEEIFYASKKRKSNKQTTLRIVMIGRVQNVGMRNWIKRKCTTLDINGWVRNKKADETVEALFQGDEDDVAEILQLCYNGPSFAHVKKIKEFPSKEESIPKGFFILPSV
jgi:acylphosphatase